MESALQMPVCLRVESDASKAFGFSDLEGLSGHVIGDIALSSNTANGEAFFSVEDPLLLQQIKKFNKRLSGQAFHQDSSHNLIAETLSLIVALPAGADSEEVRAKAGAELEYHLPKILACCSGLDKFSKGIAPVSENPGAFQQIERSVSELIAHVSSVTDAPVTPGISAMEALRLEDASVRMVRSKLAVQDPAFFVRLQDLSRYLPGDAPAGSDAHALISSLLARLVLIGSGSLSVEPGFLKALGNHLAYHKGVLSKLTSTPIEKFSQGILIDVTSPGVQAELVGSIIELLSHASNAKDRPAYDSQLIDLLPQSVAGLRTEAHIALIASWLARTLDVPGDICEFGCFRGTMSIKFAFAMKALGLNKTVYAFDTFEGFQMKDPGGGPLGPGSYANTDNAFDELTRWSAVIPVLPMKGDARETCKQLSNPLSFVWLDLDFDILMDPVLHTIRPLIGTQTIIGIDDVGRPETPTVLGWVDKLVQDGKLLELYRDENAFVRFFRPGQNF